MPIDWCRNGECQPVPVWVGVDHGFKDPVFIGCGTTGNIKMEVVYPGTDCGCAGLAHKCPRWPVERSKCVDCWYMRTLEPKEDKK